MKLLFRCSMGTGVLAALLMGGNHACPTWTARVGLDRMTDWLDVHLQLAQEHHRGEILDGQVQRTLQSLQARIRVVEDLGAHRLTLLEAAARFRDLDGLASASDLEWSRRVDPGQTDEERWCRQVIRFVRGHYRDRPVLLAAQLEVELAGHLAEGTLHLPD